MAKKKDPVQEVAFNRAYNRKKELVKQEIEVVKQEVDEKISELEQEVKIAKLTAKVANVILTKPSEEANELFKHMKHRREKER